MHALLPDTQLLHCEHVMSSTDFGTTNLVDVNCELNHNCDQPTYHQCCWWHRILFHQRTIVDADHRGRWTQIFGGKAPELETSQPVEKCNFYLPHQQLAPPLRVNPAEFRRDRLQHIIKSPWAIVRHCLWDPTFSHSDNSLWWTDRRTETHMTTANTT